MRGVLVRIEGVLPESVMIELVQLRIERSEVRIEGVYSQD
jgi:hypothetical protein